MSERGRRATIYAGSLALFVLGCEPTTISEAREQLGRAGERVIDFTLPIVDTTFRVQTLFDGEAVGLDTALGGMLEVRVDPESVVVAVGEDLTFENVTFDSLIVSFDPGAFTAPPGTKITFASSYDALSAGLRFEGLDTVVVASGSLAVTTQNRLNAAITYDLTLNGFVAPSGAAPSYSGTIPAAPGDGSYTSDNAVFDLAGVTIVPAAVRVDVSGEATIGSTPINPATGDRAIIQTGQTAFTVERVVGPLDPAQTAELTIDVEELQEIPRGNVNFDDLEDAVRDATINSATVLLTIDNGADAPGGLADFTLGVVRLDPLGNPVRSAQGDIAYEADSLGDPILVPVVDAGDTVLTLGRRSAATLELAAPTLVDRLVTLLLDDVPAALVAAGRVAIGDGSPASFRRTDEVQVVFDVAVGLDLTIPTSGVSFTRRLNQDGLFNLSGEDADQLAERVIGASVTTDVVNSTPFGVEVDIAFVAGDLAESVDVFTHQNSVLLNTVTVAEPTVDSLGRVMEASASNVRIELEGDEVRQLLEERLTAAVRVRLVPGAGGDGRGAIHADDQLTLDTRSQIQVRAGGSQ